MSRTIEPLLLLDIHHSGYLGWGIWTERDLPEEWTAETVERLARHPHYKMGLNLGGQSYEWSPHLAGRVREWLAAYPGRLFITGGDYAQPTACVRTSESNLRQLLFGLQAIREALGTEPKIWTASEPGNFAQLPQVLDDLGYTGALLRIHGPGQRGSLTPRVDEGVVCWQGPDGSQIVAVPEYVDDRTTPTDSVPYSMWIMTRYRNTRQARGSYTLDDLWRWKEKQAAKGISPVLMSKDDDHNDQFGNNNLCMSSGHLLVADTEQDRRFRWMSAQELFDELPEPQTLVAADPNLFETRAAVFNDYGYRGNLDWQADLQAEAALRLADWAAVMAAPCTDWDYEPALHQAWSHHLAAQNHDLALKNSLDVSLHLQYDAQRQAEQIRDDTLSALLPQVDTSGGEGAVVIFNPLGWDRKDYVEIEVSEALAQTVQPYLEGQPVPWEVVRWSAGRAIMGFVAEAPGLGYQTYILGPKVSAAKAPAVSVRELAGGGLSIEQGDYVAELRPGGGLAGLWTASGTCVADGPSLELLGSVNGQPARSAGKIALCHHGPVSAVVQETGQVGPYHRYEIRYRFIGGVAAIRLEVTLTAHFTDGDPGAPGVISSEHKLGLGLRLAPTLGELTCLRYQPLGVWPYDLEMDPIFGAPYWTDLSGEGAGVAWLNKGTIGYRYEATERRLDNILASGQISRSRWSLGLLAHDGDGMTAGVQAAGLGFGNPLYACLTSAHEGTWPGRGQLCAIQPDTVTVSSVFRTGGRDYVRLYEHVGAPAWVTVSDAQGPLDVEPVNLRLEPTETQTPLAPYRILTMALPRGT